MTPERWQEIRRLFHEALERPTGERTAFLDRACAGNRQLRRDLESLFASHEQAGTFLESPALDTGRERADLSSGARLGPYEITSLLGVGGMGEIYRARDTRLAREVAVKVLPAALTSDPDKLKRFEQEARAASSLNHPHIVALYDVGREEGLAYLVTELLEGQTLAERIDHGHVPVRRALDYAVQTARGLAAAHERGIVHRDVKPANLFLTNEGQIKILDFGLAKLAEPVAGAGILSGAAPATIPGLAMGTVGYMSPEQVRGETVDFRSDQFSLGCVVYELLTGEAPFRRPTGVQTLSAVLEDEPEPIIARNPRVPAPVAWIVERCLAKDAQERYAATRDLARDLELAAARLSETSATQSAGRPKKAATKVSARRAAAAAMLLVLGAVAAWFLRPARPPVPVARFLTYSSWDSSPAASPDGKTVAFSSFRDGKRRIWIKQLVIGSEVPLTEGEDDHPRFSPDGSMLLFARREGPSRVSLYRSSVVGGEARKLVGDALYGDFSPDGRRICFVRQFLAGAGTTSVVGTAFLDGSAIRELVRYPAALMNPRWSPDSRTVAVTETAVNVSARTGILLVDVETGRLRRLLVPARAGTWPRGLAWAGRRQIVYSQPESAAGMLAGGRSSIVLQDVQSRQGREVFSSPVAISMIDLIGPGRIVFEAQSVRQNLREFALAREGGSPSARWLTRGRSTDRQPVYSPDGERIVVSSNRAGRLDLWAVSRGSSAVRRLTDDEAEDWDPAFTPDGKLIWSSNRTGVFEIWIAEADGSGARQLTRDGVDAENPAATPDGLWILYTSANPRWSGIVKMRTDGSQISVVVPGNVGIPEVSPDSQYVAFLVDTASEHAALRVARFADGSLTKFEVPLPRWTPGSTIDAGRCRWFPDGRSIAFIAPDAVGAYGVHVQDFEPNRDTSSTRRLLLPSDSESAGESLAISPDGAYLTVAYWDQDLSLMVAENVPGVGRPRRAAE